MCSSYRVCEWARPPPTLAAVAMFGAGFTNTGGSVFAGVQETCIHTVSAEVTWGKGKERKKD